MPIRGLQLTKAVNNEFKIGNVIFVSKDKLPRIRKRLGFPIVVSELHQIVSKKPKIFSEQIKEFFEYSETYAITHFSGVPKNEEIENIRRIEKALNYLSFSKLGFSKRSFQDRIEIKSSDKVLHHRTVNLNKGRAIYTYGSRSLDPFYLILDKNWKEFHKTKFYFEFIKIINQEIKLNSKWKTTLVSIGNLAGKSRNSHDIPESFLRNIIAMEMLLTTQNDKILNKLVERAGYLLDWTEEWQKNDLAGRIEKMYVKRNNYVHDGKADMITDDDLIFTDDLLFNLLNAVVRNLNKVTSKQILIDFSDKYQCEKMLGLKSEYQFWKFEYLRKKYNKGDLKKI